MGVAKVLCLYGSESGTSERALKQVAKHLGGESAGKFTIEKITDGNEFSTDATFESLAKSYDVLLVATSSYGEGDPPDNIARFLARLLRASNANETPLKGLQHGVLGIGESVYDTFQNCPRLVDKYLGKCGSRRLVVRHEVDGAQDYAGSESDATPEKQIARFASAVLKVLTKLPSATAAPVCDWTKPESKLLEKTEAELVGAFLGGEGGGSMMIMAAIAAAVGAAGYAYYTGMI